MTINFTTHSLDLAAIEVPLSISATTFEQDIAGYANTNGHPSLSFGIEVNADELPIAAEDKELTPEVREFLKEVLAIFEGKSFTPDVYSFHQAARTAR